MATPQPNNDVTITSQCLCKAHIFTAHLPSSQLPLKATNCHCTSCRHLSGAMFSSDAPWPGPDDQILRSTLQKYQVTPRVDQLFCGTCYTPMFFQEAPDTPSGPPHLGVFTSTLSNNPAALVHTEFHMFLADTLDGGASIWLRNPNPDGVRPALWSLQKGQSEELPQGWPKESDIPAPQSPDKVPIWCKCRGVELVYNRAAANAEYAGMPVGDLPFFVEPGRFRTIATFDADDSCRVSGGADVFHWTFVLLRHLERMDGGGRLVGDSGELRALVDEGKVGTLAYYESSPGVQRYSCGRCSAAFFYAADDRPEMVDLAIGVMEGPDGARAEGTLVWGLGSPVGWKEDTEGGWREGYVKAVTAEAEAWRVDRGIPKNYRRAAREEAEEKGEPFSLKSLA